MVQGEGGEGAAAPSIRVNSPPLPRHLSHTLTSRSKKRDSSPYLADTATEELRGVERKEEGTVSERAAAQRVRPCRALDRRTRGPPREGGEGGGGRALALGG